MIDDQDDDGANHGHEHAPEIEACDSDLANRVEDGPADDRTDNAEHDVQDDALAGLVDDLARDKTCDQPEYDPANDGHRHLQNAVEIATPVAGITIGRTIQLQFSRGRSRGQRLAVAKSTKRAAEPDEGRKRMSRSPAPRGRGAERSEADEDLVGPLRWRSMESVSAT